MKGKKKTAKSEKRLLKEKMGIFEVGRERGAVGALVEKKRKRNWRKRFLYELLNKKRTMYSTYANRVGMKASRWADSTWNPPAPTTKF